MTDAVWVDRAKQVVNSIGFHRGVIALIILAGVVTGLETDPSIRQAGRGWLRAIDLLIVVAFTFELALRLFAKGRSWPQFFRDPWNVFDFAIVALCWLPLNTAFAPVLRLVRVLRVLRLIPNLPQLQTLVGALLKSIPPMSYIALLLLLLFYVYAVAGVMLFGRNDPLHFGSLPQAMLSLFQVATLENWSDLLKIQMLGSANYGYDGQQHLIIQSSAQPLAAVLYFVSFIMIGTMVILNLLIGVVVNSMTEARLEVEKAERERHRRESGHPTLRDEIIKAEQQLGELQKQLHLIRNRMSDQNPTATAPSGKPPAFAKPADPQKQSAMISA